MSRNGGCGRGQRGRFLFLPLAVVATVLILAGLSTYFHGLASSPYGAVPYSGWWLGWPFFGFGWVFFPLFFILLFFGFRWFLWGGWGWRAGRYGRCGDPAMDTLRERYARGEVTKEQFDRMASDLEGE